MCEIRNGAELPNNGLKNKGKEKQCHLTKIL